MNWINESLIFGTPKCPTFLCCTIQEHQKLISSSPRQKIQHVEFWSSRYLDKTSADGWPHDIVPYLKQLHPYVVLLVSIHRTVRTWSLPWSPCCKDDIHSSYWSRRIWCLINPFWFTDTLDRLNKCCCYGNFTAFWGYNLKCLTCRDVFIFPVMYIKLIKADEGVIIQSVFQQLQYAQWQYVALETVGLACCVTEYNMQPSLLHTLIYYIYIQYIHNVRPKLEHVSTCKDLLSLLWISTGNLWVHKRFKVNI